MAVEAATPKSRTLSLENSRALRAALRSEGDTDGKRAKVVQVGRLGRFRIPLRVSLTEVLILVPFALLLVIGSQMARVQKQATEARDAYEKLEASIPMLQPILENLRQTYAMDRNEVRAFIGKLASTIEVAKARDALVRENADLRSRLATTPPTAGPQDVHEAAVDAGRLQVARNDGGSPAKDASLRDERGPSNDRRHQSSGIERDEQAIQMRPEPTEPVEKELGKKPRSTSELPSKKEQGLRARTGGNRQAANRSIQARPGCANDAFARLRLDRSQVSAWCP